MAGQIHMRINTTALVALILCGCGSTASGVRSIQAPSVTRARATPRPAKTVTGPHRPPAVRVASTAYGRALVDRRGFALYLFTHDRSGTSACYGACAAAWP